MTGFDSESDRRDAIRKQIVDVCLFRVQETISLTAVTSTPEERATLMLDVILGLLESIRIDARQAMWIKETKDAEKAIDDPRKFKYEA
jgi:hypothetical protein